MTVRLTAGTGWLMTRGTVWSVGESAAGCMTETGTWLVGESAAAAIGWAGTKFSWWPSTKPDLCRTTGPPGEADMTCS